MKETKMLTMVLNWSGVAIALALLVLMILPSVIDGTGKSAEKAGVSQVSTSSTSSAASRAASRASRPARAGARVVRAGVRVVRAQRGARPARVERPGTHSATHSAMTA